MGQIQLIILTQGIYNFLKKEALATSITLLGTISVAYSLSKNISNSGYTQAQIFLSEWVRIFQQKSKYQQRYANTEACRYSMYTSIVPHPFPLTSNIEQNKTTFLEKNKSFLPPYQKRQKINTTNLDLWNHLFCIDKYLEKSNRSQTPELPRGNILKHISLSY